MPGQLNIHFSVVFNTQNILSTFPMPYHISREQFISRHADMPSSLRLNNLGTSFRCCFEHLGVFDDISNAISYQQEAVHLTPEGDADIPANLNNLRILFQCHFECTGDLVNISNAISCHQRAVHLTPKGHTSLILNMLYWARHIPHRIIRMRLTSSAPKRSLRRCAMMENAQRGGQRLRNSEVRGEGGAETELPASRSQNRLFHHIPLTRRLTHAR